MQILKNSPGAGEICVERVKTRRFAEANGDDDSLFKGFNDALTAAAVASQRRYPTLFTSSLPFPPTGFG